MRYIALIPARYQSSRFPGKPLALICGKPMIQHVYERVSAVPQIHDVYVASDDERIFNAVQQFGGKAVMTASVHQCGTERITECADILGLDDTDMILNIQGDEPLVSKGIVDDLISCLNKPDTVMATLKKEIGEEERADALNNPNVVKVVTDAKGNALYFSRCCIPYNRAGNTVRYYKHIGMYGYPKWFLKKFCSMEKTALEMTESLEQLRVLESGYKIRVKETRHPSIGVDTPSQLKTAEKIMEMEL